EGGRSDRLRTPAASKIAKVPPPPLTLCRRQALSWAGFPSPQPSNPGGGIPVYGGSSRWSRGVWAGIAASAARAGDTGRVWVPAAPATSVDLAPGQIARVSGTDGRGLRMRAQPSLSAPTVIALGEGDEVRVVGGPVSADRVRWYQIRSGADTGWSVESYLVLAGSSAGSTGSAPGQPQRAAATATARPSTPTPTPKPAPRLAAGGVATVAGTGGY